MSEFKQKADRALRGALSIPALKGGASRARSVNETRPVALPAAPGLDVFISYARENRPVAEQLADALKADSLRVWWDREIPGGAEFADVIEAQLHGARVVLVLWSADSVHSSFVRDESTRALSAGKLLPARIEDVQLPLGFGQIHTLDLIDWDGDSNDEGFRKLLREVRQLCGKPMLADGEPDRPARRKWRSYGVAAVVAVAICGLAYGGKTIWDRNEARNLFSAGLERQFASEPNLESARNLYLSALEHQPGHARARYYLAHVYAQLGQSDPARLTFEQALTYSEAPLDEGQRKVASKQLTALSAAPAEPAAVVAAAGSRSPGSEAGPGDKTTDPLKPSKAPPRIEPEAPTLARLATLVDGMFDEQKEKRITATTSIVVDLDGLSDAVPIAVAKALALLRQPSTPLSPSASSGVVNTLVLLQSALPGTLETHRKSIDALIAASPRIGEYTRQQADKVSELLRQAATQRPLAYIQIANEAQRPIADALSAQLRSFGYDAPDIELVGSRAPSRTEVRVQGKSDRGYARWVAKRVGDAVGAVPTISTLRNAKPKRDTYEIWLDRDLCAPSGRQVTGCTGAGR